MKKTTFIVSVAIAILAGVISGYLLTHKDLSVSAISTAGTTGSTGKYLSQTMSLADSTGTTTSIFNPFGRDIAVRSVDVMCQGVGTSQTAYTGAGLSALNIEIATSSTNTITGNVAQINTNYLGNINISTSTVNSYIASSTEGVLVGTSRIIPSGTYAIISSNATNTAACAIGLSVMPL